MCNFNGRNYLSKFPREKNIKFNSLLILHIYKRTRETSVVWIKIVRDNYLPWKLHVLLGWNFIFDNLGNVKSHLFRKSHIFLFRKSVHKIPKETDLELIKANGSDKGAFKLELQKKKVVITNTYWNGNYDTNVIEKGIYQSQ